MNKVKLILTLFTLAIIVSPFAYVLVAYRDNLVGLVLPPQFSNLVQNLSQNTGANPMLPSNNPLNVTGANLTIPQLVGTPEYNPATGDFNVAVNATNPLPNVLSISQLTVQIQSKDNSSLIGNISIPQAFNIEPGQSAIICVEGVMPQQLYDQINNQTTGTMDVNSILLENLNVTVNGVNVHMDQIDPASLQSLLGGSA